ncbi:16133_t:CDS:2 [Funneliformis mosseae]|uniref:16133_t:CDS:1 n=1 Tax=Funneliformis mosseae TaxID=27381 RepID=A0A9N9EKD5_FUNMO|nr:16133_t:CDS:2 [Funneliformis mosseae]
MMFPNFSGVIDAELHFGANRWISCNKETEFLVPIRLRMKKMTFLKGYNFVKTVVKDNKEHSECPGYLSDCGNFILTNQYIFLCLELRNLRIVNGNMPGLGLLRIINETTAAAIAYGLDKKSCGIKFSFQLEK